MRIHFLIFILLFVRGAVCAQGDTLVLTFDQFKRIEKYGGVSSFIVQRGNSSDTTLYWGGVKYPVNELPADKKFIRDYFIACEKLECIKVMGPYHKVLRIYHTDGETYKKEFREYDENGKLKRAGAYAMDGANRREGTWYYYNKYGRVIKRKCYNEKGRPVKCIPGK